MLAQQWCGQPQGARVLQPSNTVRYTYSAAAATAAIGRPCPPAVNPVQAFTIGDQPVDASRSYRVTVNSFLADGGDGFSVVREGTDRLGGPVDTDALEQYVAPSLTGPPIDPPPRDRITLVP